MVIYLAGACGGHAAYLAHDIFHHVNDVIEKNHHHHGDGTLSHSHSSFVDIVIQVLQEDRIPDEEAGTSRTIFSEFSEHISLSSDPRILDSTKIRFISMTKEFQGALTKPQIPPPKCFS